MKVINNAEIPVGRNFRSSACTGLPTYWSDPAWIFGRGKDYQRVIAFRDIVQEVMETDY